MHGASLGETCSHVAGLLFKTEAAVHTDYTKTACTDEACRWNIDFVKKVKRAEISDIDFYSASLQQMCNVTAKIKVNATILNLCLLATTAKQSRINLLKTCQSSNHPPLNHILLANTMNLLFQNTNLHREPSFP